ncbi:hypothetical protein AAHE18_06G118800 [Arachis hypogaea]
MYISKMFKIMNHTTYLIKNLAYYMILFYQASSFEDTYSSNDNSNCNNEINVILWYSKPASNQSPRIHVYNKNSRISRWKLELLQEFAHITSSWIYEKEEELYIVKRQNIY